MQDHFIIFTLPVNLGCQCQKFVIFCHVTFQDHPACHLEKAAQIQSFITKFFYNHHCLTKHSSGDQYFKQCRTVNLCILTEIHFFKIFIKLLILNIRSIVIQNLFSYRISILFCTVLKFCQTLKILQIIRIQRCRFAIIQQKSPFSDSQFQKFRYCLAFICELCKIVWDCRNITSLLIILEQDHRIICIDSRICNSFIARVDFFLCKLTVPHDHLSDFAVITIQTIGKHLRSDCFSIFSTYRIKQEFLIQDRIIFIHLSFSEFAIGKPFQIILIIFICFRIFFFKCNHTRIYISLACITK